MQKYFKTSRVVIALLFFIAVIISFSDIKGVLPSGFYKSVLYLQFIPSLLKFITPGTIISAGFIIVLIITIIGGRIYCSAICPLGIFQDIIIFFKRKIKSKYRPRFKKALNILRYSFLGVAIISLLFSGLIVVNLLDPYANFGRIASNLLQPITVFSNNIVARFLPFLGLHPLVQNQFHLASFIVATLVLLVVMSMSWIQGRLYCNSICPVGTFLGLVSKLSFNKIKISDSACTRCGKCLTACKANCIDIKTMYVDESRCINCFNCIQACEDSAIGYMSTKHLKRAVTDSGANLRLRFFMLSAAGYITTKLTPVIASSSSSEQDDENIHTCYWERGVVTPPGSKSTEHLKSRCISCHLCISVCPTKVLQPSFLEYGFTGMLMPKMDYMVHFCNYDCTKCGEVCPTGAIMHLPVNEKKITQIGKVQFVKEYCIVETDGTACGSCSEHCPTQAVKMVPYKNDLTIPETDTSICIGCGACEYACPVEYPHKAIFVVSSNPHLLAEKPVSESIEYEEKEDFPF